MRLSARSLANRRNARRSTGPKTAAGKSIVARNALRHGLAVPVELNPILANDVEQLTSAIAGEGAGALRRERARRVAEAQIDLIRIRKARLALLAEPRERVKPMPVSAIKREISAVKRRLRVDDAAYKERDRNAPERSRERFELEWDVEEAFDEMSVLIDRRLPLNFIPPPLAEGLSVLAPKLARLDRYERRALSRRKRAIPEFD
jgi:hypothetical protein